MIDRRMWMVRSDGGAFYEQFREQGIAALGWKELARMALDAPKSEWLDVFERARPDLKYGAIQNGVSQVLRFVREVSAGDAVVTYNPSTRRYLLGEFGDELRRDAEDPTGSLVYIRSVSWIREFDRDSLSTGAKNTLGSTLSFFLVPAAIADEVAALERTKPAEVPQHPLADGQDDEADEKTVRQDIEGKAQEFIKDKLIKLDGYEMQAVVAAILRAMGYKTREAPRGPDRGLDILASPDGLGFEAPRIAVEVKHRSGQIGSQDLRSFIGGRHRDDRGLYVSTGGFTKDARYEADRAQIPTMLWELDDIVRYLTEHYEHIDVEVKQMVPLRRLYWPM